MQTDEPMHGPLIHALAPFCLQSDACVGFVGNVDLAVTGDDRKQSCGAQKIENVRLADGFRQEEERVLAVDWGHARYSNRKV